MGLIHEYISTVTPAQQAEFERICRIVKQTVPAIDEGISYGIPAFIYKGKPLFAFAATKKHLSIYPFNGKVVEKLRDKLSDFELTSGTIRFSLENPIPEPIIKEIVICRLAEIDARIK